MQTKPNWNCGLTRVMDALSSKWALQIFWVISQKSPIRFNQLKREVGGITKIMLTRSLDSLIQNKLIFKEDFKTWPLHTQYSLTNKGKELLNLLMSLNGWGRENL
ncbi:winged helix-turn-helix transcriptional regulator [Streptococcus mutans]|uniref:winged helix-turn-helix transcriptional regulator n=1 Tax=Streptococcus mutans TaxID=1309 RepID=UPI000316433C|nr:helix-turn-helix domain-containing protein [Streptococcus mutans]NLQ43906.1 transcriptional regulator [Streptococcus mutans]NLQ67511.1 transcriptional regulator [Streptococcus mutans]